MNVSHQLIILQFRKGCYLITGRPVISDDKTTSVDKKIKNQVYNLTWDTGRGKGGETIQFSCQEHETKMKVFFGKFVRYGDDERIMNSIRYSGML